MEINNEIQNTYLQITFYNTCTLYTCPLFLPEENRLLSLIYDSFNYLFYYRLQIVKCHVFKTFMYLWLNT